MRNRRMRLTFFDLERVVAMAVLVAAVVFWAKAPQWCGADGMKTAIPQFIVQSSHTALALDRPMWLHASQPGGA
jgi:hypothetical protein